MTYIQSIVLGDISRAHSDPSQVVVKRLLPVSLRDNFFQGRIGEEKLWMKKPLFLLLVYSTHKKAAQ